MKFINNGGHYVVNFINIDEQEIDVFKQVGPIVTDVNELLKRVKRLNQQIDISHSKRKFIYMYIYCYDFVDEDQLAKITNIFCAEIDKPSNPQRQMMDDEIFYGQNNGKTTKIDSTDSLYQHISGTIEESMTNVITIQ